MKTAGESLKSTQAALIDQAVRGDRPSLELLLLGAYPIVADYIASRLTPFLVQRTSREDLLQETFSVAFRNVATFKYCGEGSFEAWLCAIAEHRMADAVRHYGSLKRRHGLRQADISPVDDQSLLDLFVQVRTDSETPSKVTARRESAERMRVALAGLPAAYEQAIRLTFLEGMSLEQAARTMQRSVPAVHGLLDRGKRRLRQALGRSSLYFTKK